MSDINSLEMARIDDGGEHSGCNRKKAFDTVDEYQP
jgi:hypothetical protein